QLVLSVGRNKQEVAGLLQKLPLLDCKVKGSEVVKSLPVLSTQWCNRAGHLQALQQAEVATLIPGKEVHVMVRDAGKPLVAGGAWGVGRGALVPFALAAPPFPSWDGKISFWPRLRAGVAPYMPARQPNRPGGPGVPGRGMPGGAPAMPGGAEDAGAGYEA